MSLDILILVKLVAGYNRSQMNSYQQKKYSAQYSYILNINSMKRIFFVFLFLINALNSTCQKKINFLFSIKLDSFNVNEEKDLNIRLIFVNFGDTNLLVTRQLQYTYKKGIRPKSGDLIWEVEKLSKGKYYEQSVKTLFSPLPFYVPKEEQFDTLAPKKNTFKIFPLYYFYQLDVGVYRVRAKYIIPSQSGLPIKFLYSNWLKFNIKKPIRYFSSS